jgi:hypothetical protein
MELVHHNHVVWWNQKMGLSAFHTPEALTISIHDLGVYEVYREQEAARRTLEGF